MYQFGPSGKDLAVILGFGGAVLIAFGVGIGFVLQWLPPHISAMIGMLIVGLIAGAFLVLVFSD